MSGPQSGDPFAMAYRRDGNAVAAARTEAQRLAAVDAEVARKGKDAYKGYGFSTPGPTCPPNPTDALADCLRAMEQVLEGAIQRTEEVPYHKPPFHARPFSDYVEVVLSTTAGLNGPTNTAGLLLQAANTLYGVAPQLQEMSAVSSGRPLYTLEPQQSYMARIATWGVDFGPAGPKAVELVVKGSTVGGARPDPPNPFTSGFTAGAQQDTFVVLDSKSPLTIEGRLRDVTLGPVLIRIGVTGWLWVTNKRTGTRKGTILKSGYGADC